MSFLINPFRVAPSGHLYWRVYMTDNHGGARCGSYEIEMRATAGGADQCSGGTATASSTLAGSVGNLFDNNYTTTFWSSNSGAAEWVKYQFASPVNVTELAITCYSAGALNFSVKNGKLQWSDDNSSWTDAFSFTMNAVTVLKLRTFPETITAGYSRIWRLFCTDANGGTRIEIGELEFRATAGGADQTANSGAGDGDANGRSFASSYFAGSENAFDNNDASPWRALTNVNEWVAWVAPDPIKIEEIRIAHASGFLTDRMPKNMKLEYSDDNTASWTTQKTFAAQTGWTNGESRTLTAI